MFRIPVGTFPLTAPFRTSEKCPRWAPRNPGTKSARVGRAMEERPHPTPAAAAGTFREDQKCPRLSHDRFCHAWAWQAKSAPAAAPAHCPKVSPPNRPSRAGTFCADGRPRALSGLTMKVPPCALLSGTPRKCRRRTTRPTRALSRAWKSDAGTSVRRGHFTIANRRTRALSLNVPAVAPVQRRPFFWASRKVPAGARRLWHPARPAKNGKVPAGARREGTMRKCPRRESARGGPSARFPVGKVLTGTFPKKCPRRVSGGHFGKCPRPPFPSKVPAVNAGNVPARTLFPCALPATLLPPTPPPGV